VKKPRNHPIIISKVSAKWLLTIWILLGLIPAFSFLHGKYTHRTAVHAHLSQKISEGEVVEISLPSSTDVLGEQFDKKDFFWKGDWYDVISVNRTPQQIEIVAVIDDEEKGIDIAFQRINSHSDEDGVLVEHKFDGVNLFVIGFEIGLMEIISNSIKQYPTGHSINTISGYFGIEIPPPELKS
jgi:hypothetical protein